LKNHERDEYSIILKISSDSVRNHRHTCTNASNTANVTDAEQKHIFESWLNQHKGLLFKVIRAYATTTMDRDDLFQEITIHVWRSVPAFRNEAAVTTWLYRIALNTAMKWMQRERKHDHTQDLEQVQHLLHENNTVADDRLRWLYHEIHQLDSIDRSVTLLMLDGFSYKEMAAILGITESNVGVKINRIKKHLAAKAKTYDRDGL